MVKSEKTKRTKTKKQKTQVSEQKPTSEKCLQSKTLLSLSFGFVRLSATLCILQLQCLLKKQYHAWEMLKLYSYILALSLTVSTEIK